MRIAQRRAARLEEIAEHGRPVSFRKAVHKFKKYYILHFDKSNQVPEGAELRFSRAAEDEETGGIYLLFYIVHPSMPNQPFLQVSSNAYHEIANSGRNLDEIFGNQGTDYLEVSQFIMQERLGGDI